MVPWPGLHTTYSIIYRTFSASLFESFGSRVYARFHRTNDTEHDIKIIFFNSDRQPFRAVDLTSRHSGYIYTAFIIALILATPVSWKRKGLALFWGMIVIHCFLVIKMAVLILFVFSHLQSPQTAWNPFWHKVQGFLPRQTSRRRVFPLPSLCVQGRCKVYPFLPDRDCPGRGWYHHNRAGLLCRQFESLKKFHNRTTLLSYPILQLFQN